MSPRRAAQADMRRHRTSGEFRCCRTGTPRPRDGRAATAPAAIPRSQNESRPLRDRIACIRRIDGWIFGPVRRKARLARRSRTLPVPPRPGHPSCPPSGRTIVVQKIVDNNLLTFVVSALHVGLVVLTFAAVVIAFEADCTADVHFRCKYR